MRKNHIIGGLIAFGLGLFLLYFYSPYVVELVKGAVNPILILVGLLAMAAAILGEKESKRMNIIVAVVFLFLGLYGVYEEYYAVMDFFHGLFPPLLIVAGLVSITHGIKKLA